jgi:uncharacterized protein YggE
MRSATMREATRQLARRELLLGGFTFLMAVVGLASLAAVAIAGTGAGLRTPGVGSGPGPFAGQPSLVATGYGEASVPAETATLQMLLGPGDYPDMMIGDGSARPAGEDPAAAAAEASRPIVEALQTAGIAPGDIRTVVSPSLDPGFQGPAGGQYGVRIDITVHQPSGDGMNRLVNAAGAAAMAGRLGLAQVGVEYGVADCAPLERQARERANADARAKAEQQAELLGSPLGALILASDAPATSAGTGSPGGGCAPPAARSVPLSPWDRSGLVTFPAFDPAAPAEATARVEVSLTFSLSEE